MELQNKNYARNTIKVYMNKLNAYFDFLKGYKYGSYREYIINFINSQNGEVSKRHAYYALNFFYKLVLKKECPYILKNVIPINNDFVRFCIMFYILKNNF